MFCLRIALVFLAIWLLLVAGNLEESDEWNPILLQALMKPQERKVICQKRPSYGACQGKRNLWYFFLRLGECLPFTYSNCGGNRNRFHSYDDCMDFCTDRNTERPNIQDLLDKDY